MNECKPSRTCVNDIVLVYRENQPVFFARVEKISEDIKPGWFHLTLLMLTLPMQEITWILKDIYIDGTEFFINGDTMKIQKIESKASVNLSPSKPKAVEGKKTGAKVLDFSKLKKI